MCLIPREVSGYDLAGARLTSLGRETRKGVRWPELVDKGLADEEMASLGSQRPDKDDRPRCRKSVLLPPSSPGYLFDWSGSRPQDPPAKAVDWRRAPRAR